MGGREHLVAVRRVHGILDPVRPERIGSELEAAVQVEDDVDAERDGAGHRVDEPLDEPARQAVDLEVFALGQVQPVIGRVQVDAGRLRRLVRSEPGAVDHDAGADLQVRAVRVLERHPVARSLAFDPQRLAAVGVHDPPLAPQRLEPFHEGVAVEDAGGRRVEGGRGGDLGLDHRDLGLERRDLGGRDQARVAHAIAVRRGEEIFQERRLFPVGGHDQLAQPLVGDVICLEKIVQEIPAAHAQPGFQRVLGIIETGVNDLAVAARSLPSERGMALHHDNGAFPEPLRERVRDGQSDRPRADDQKIGFFHSVTSLQTYQTAIAFRRRRHRAVEKAQLCQRPAIAPRRSDRRIRPGCRTCRS